jgi:uncharacterized protein (DUF1778 family)
VALKPVNLRVPEEAHARWKEAAQERGVTLTAFLSEAADSAIGIVKPQARASTKTDCPRWMHHRLGVFCKTCGVTP